MLFRSNDEENFESKSMAEDDLGFVDSVPQGDSSEDMEETKDNNIDELTSSLETNLQISKDKNKSVEKPIYINKRKKIHRCVVNNNVTLYYRIKKGEVELITFFQSRQRQSKRKL